MRKMDAASLKTDFVDDLNDLSTFYQSTSAALTSAKEQTFLVENSLLAAAVLWEGFVSDLLVAYVNRDLTRFAVHLQDALEAALVGKPRAIYDRYVTLKVPAHLKKADIIELADANKNNVTFSKFADFEEKAGVWLVAAHAARVAAVAAPQRAVVDSLIAVRNHLAHRSDRSLSAMNTAIRAGALHTTSLRRANRKVHHVGAYLKTYVPARNATRLEIFLTELRAIATSL